MKKLKLMLPIFTFSDAFITGSSLIEISFSNLALFSKVSILDS